MQPYGMSDEEMEAAGISLGSAQPGQEQRMELPSDVARLVVIARHIAFGGHFDEANEDQQALLRELEQASEAFAGRVPWEDEPDLTLEEVAGLVERINETTNLHPLPANHSTATKALEDAQRVLSNLADEGAISNKAPIFASIKAALTRPTADLVEDGDLVERLRADADRQDGEEESIVSTNVMRNAADRIELYREALEAISVDYCRELCGGCEGEGHWPECEQARAVLSRSGG